jgi:hypothetical protein
VKVDSPIYFTFALVKQMNVTHFEAKLEVPQKWTAGAIVAFADTKNYLGVVHASDGMVRTFTSTNGSAIWNDVGPAPPPSNSLEIFSADFSGAIATLTFNGKAYSMMPTFPLRAGLAASDTTARFIDLAWK